MLIEPDPDASRADRVRPSEMLVGFYNQSALGVIQELRVAVKA